MELAEPLLDEEPTGADLAGVAAGLLTLLGPELLV
jgi:hypothetical protein